MSNTAANEIAKAMGFKPSKTDEMFNRAEALQNTAKAIKGLKALDEEALEILYLEAKAERRARGQKADEKAKEIDVRLHDVIKEASLKPLGSGKKTPDTPHIQIGYRFGCWFWSEHGYNGSLRGVSSSFDTKELAVQAAQTYLERDNRALPIIYV